MICFKCDRLGHKEENCKIFRTSNAIERDEGLKHPNNEHVKAQEEKVVKDRPEVNDKYGAWMMTQRSTRKYAPKGRSVRVRNKVLQMGLDSRTWCRRVEKNGGAPKVRWIKIRVQMVRDLKP